MRKYWWLIIAGLLLIIVAAGVDGFLLGDIQAVRGISIMRATPHQLAEAMKQDRFFFGGGGRSQGRKKRDAGVARRRVAQKDAVSRADKDHR